MPENALGLGGDGDDDDDDDGGGGGYSSDGSDKSYSDGEEGGGAGMPGELHSPAKDPGHAPLLNARSVSKGSNSLARWLARGGRARKNFAIRAIRTSLLLVCSALAYACRDLLGDVEALVGSVASMSTTIILPSMCYMQLSRMAPDTSLSTGELAGNGLIVVMGLATTVVVTVGAVKDMTAS